jgi:hypothetical protein
MVGRAEKHSALRHTRSIATPPRVEPDATIAVIGCGEVGLSAVDGQLKLDHLDFGAAQAGRDQRGLCGVEIRLVRQPIDFGA